MYSQIINTSIQAFLGMMTFVECFINSIAYDYYQRTGVDESLHNYVENPSTRTIHKLLIFPMIVKDKKSLDEIKQYVNQLKNIKFASDDFENPYNTILKEFAILYEHRNSYIHHSPNQFVEKPKTPIILNPIDWYNYAEKAFEVCIPIAKKFWKECGHDNGPFYLANLDIKELDQVGYNLLTQEIHVLGDLITNKYFKSKP